MKLRNKQVCVKEGLTCPLLSADPRALQVGGLNKDAGGVQGVGGESVEAVLGEASGDGDLMLPFAGGCGRKRRSLLRLHYQRSLS